MFGEVGKTWFEGDPSAIGYGSVGRDKIKPYTTRAGTVLPSLLSLSVEQLSTPETVEDGDEVVL